MSNPLPTSLIEAIRYFADPDVSNDFVAQLRWPDGPVCPRCDCQHYSYIKTRRLWKCASCKKQYSVKLGTIFEDSPIPLDKWLCAIWLIANSKNGVSSHELGRAIGITQKSAWFVLHRIRLAMQIGSFERFDGEVETDETGVGGSTRNMHTRVRKQKNIGPNQNGKTMVVGTLQRGTDNTPSRVRSEVILDTQWDSPQGHVRRTVEPGAHLYTDGAGYYRGMHATYKHESTDHNDGEYVRGRVTTNGIENFWALLDRGIHGTYVQIAPEHLFRYVDERVFTFNHRDLSDLGRFSLALQGIADRRLTWDALTTR